MDKLTCYRELIKQGLTKHAQMMRSQPLPTEEVVCLFEEETDNYLLIHFGWPAGKRLYSVTLHLRLANGKIYVEQDWTEDFLMELLEAGVPKEDMVLAFTPPKLRDLSDYAVA